MSLAKPTSIPRLDVVFAGRSPGLWPFVTAGLPSLAALADLLLTLESVPGVRGVEVGVPYSDPIADGPVIQDSYTRVLRRGFRVADALAGVQAARARGLRLPVLLMVSYSIVHRRGERAFCEQAAESGVDGLIVPDLSLESADGLASAASHAGLRLCPLASPATSGPRRERIARLTTGFVYYMSVVGITGERDRLRDALAGEVRGLRDLGGRPVCVGFGISTAEHVRDVAGLADGAIVGTALVRRMLAAQDAGADDVGVIATARSFASELASLLPRDL